RLKPRQRLRSGVLPAVCRSWRSTIPSTSRRYSRHGRHSRDRALASSSMSRTWETSVPSPEVEAALTSILESAGYQRRSPWSGSGPGCYEIEFDVDPRHGTQTVTLYVIENPEHPVVERLEAALRAR